MSWAIRVTWCSSVMKIVWLIGYIWRGPMAWLIDYDDVDHKFHILWLICKDVMVHLLLIAWITVGDGLADWLDICSKDCIGMA